MKRIIKRGAMMAKAGRVMKVAIGLVIAILAVYFLLRGNFKRQLFTKDTPEFYFKQGVILTTEASKYMKTRDWERSIRKYKEALKRFQSIKQRFPDWKTSVVTEEYTKCQNKIDLLEATSLSSLAYRLYGERKYDDSIRLYNKFLTKYGEKYKDTPAVCAAWGHLGIMYRRKGKYEEALDIYNMVLNKYQGSKYQYFRNMSQFGIGSIYQSLGRYDEAEEAFQRIIAEDKSSTAQLLNIFLEVLPVRSWEQLGGAFPIIEEFISTHMSEKEFQTSIIKVNKSLEKDTLAFIGLKLQMEGKIDDAKEYYQRCIDSSPNKESIGYKLAIIALQKLEKIIK